MRRMLTYLAILKRLHWATWVAMSVVLMALVLIMVPGDHQNRDSLIPTTDWEQACYQLRADASAQWRSAAEKEGPSLYFYATTFSHGWPSPFLARALVYDAQHHPSKPLLGKKSSFAS